MNDPELQYWIYTDEEGYVKKSEIFNENDIIDKFKSPTNDESELIGVSKTPIYKGSRLDENLLRLLNLDELERALFSKQSDYLQSYNEYQMKIIIFLVNNKPKS